MLILKLGLCYSLSIAVVNSEWLKAKQCQIFYFCSIFQIVLFVFLNATTTIYTTPCIILPKTTAQTYIIPENCSKNDATKAKWCE